MQLPAALHLHLVAPLPPTAAPRRARRAPPPPPPCRAAFSAAEPPAGDGDYPAAPPADAPRKYGRRGSRGRALLAATLRAGDARDPVLVAAAAELNARRGFAGAAASGAGGAGAPAAPEAARLVQWYPGHIAKAERALRDKLSAVDVVIEVRDGRAPLASAHPGVRGWVGARPRLLVLNRVDMVPPRAAAAWRAHFAAAGEAVFWTHGGTGEGVPALAAAARAAAAAVNAKRAARGLRPRAARAALVGLPNVGKSALINRLLGRRVAESAARPGVTRALAWARLPGGDLELLDAPGVIPAALRDQRAAARLAMCDDIGGAAYVDSLVAAELLRVVLALPEGDAIARRLEERYKVRLADAASEEDYLAAVAERLFNGEPERAGQRLLRDFRTLALGRICLERPPARPAAAAAAAAAS